MKRINLETILQIHSNLITETGGIDGLRDEPLLLSALFAPFATFDGIYLHETIQKQAAILCHGLINNHAFIDGNKRIGILAMLTFLAINNIKISCTDAELVALGLGIAESKISKEGIMEWIMVHEAK